MSGPRERLVDAMTVVAARHGYAEASVARVLKQAGMSRATFYEYFEDRDDCFLAAVRRAAEPIREELAGGEGRAFSADRPREVIEQMLSAADADPTTTRLLLIEAMAGDARVRAEYEGLLDAAEAAIDGYLDDAATRLPPLEIPARALLGGVVNLVGMRVFRREGGLEAMRDDLLTWLGSHALPPGRRRLDQADWRELGRAWVELDTEPPSTPSNRVVERLWRQTAGEGSPDQRRRVIEAVARCSRQHGYAGTTVADIVAAAGIGRAAFYEQFRGKEDAYLAAQANGLEGGAAVAGERFFVEAPWPDRVWGGCDGLLEYLAERADLAYMQLVESNSVGPAALRRSFENRMAFTLFLEEGYRQRPEAEALPRVASEAIAGAIEELFRHHTARGHAERARELVPQCAYVSIAPFLGAEAALEFVRDRCGRPA